MEPLIKGCPDCRRALVSARWSYFYKSGRVRRITRCAACGFTTVTRGAIVSASIGPATLEGDMDSAPSKERNTELERLRAAVRAARAVLERFHTRRRS